MPSIGSETRRGTDLSVARTARGERAVRGAAPRRAAAAEECAILFVGDPKMIRGIPAHPARPGWTCASQGELSRSGLIGSQGYGGQEASTTIPGPPLPVRLRRGALRSRLDGKYPGSAGRGQCPRRCSLAFAGTIPLSHLHWDHVHGLPFFQAGDTEGARVTLLLPEQEDGACAEAVLERGMSPPHFPIRPRDLRGAWTFGALAPGHYATGGFEIEAREIPHKGGRTLGYRVSDGSSVLAYLPDHCPTLLGPGPDGWGEYHAAATALAKDADVLVHDASLLPEELAAEASFGHAAADYAVGLAGSGRSQARGAVPPPAGPGRRRTRQAGAAGSPGRPCRSPWPRGRAYSGCESARRNRGRLRA